MSAKISAEKRKIGQDVIEHWYTLVPGQHFSTTDFYGAVTEEIQAQKVPGLEIETVDLSEGGALSDKREYLRMKRERLTFDICAAPVGVNYFFSYRFYSDMPTAILAEAIVLSLIASFIAWLFTRIMGPFYGLLVVGLVLVTAAWLVRNTIGLGLRDFDAALMNGPFAGIYERFFRKDTYYRQDMRIAYCSIVSAIVKQKVESVTAAKGVLLYREHTYSPVFHDLYAAKQVSPGKVSAEASS